MINNHSAFGAAHAFYTSVAPASTDTHAASPPVVPDSQPDSAFSEWANAWQATDARYSGFEWVKKDLDERVAAQSVVQRARISELDDKIKKHPDDIEHLEAWHTERTQLFETISGFRKEAIGQLSEAEHQAFEHLEKKEAINKMFLEDMIFKVFFENDDDPEEDPL